ncbi:RHS repeat-associated core domain-containing protein [Lentzea sp. BCCO 10_0061]|uniref:RHS repeat-associated core domain-containing protein n=1 Tax=Lentzea sokolovensis TaxID=3095429 RepID=A0ABU4V7U7_9PSEU|nr:RHS repeat-associated core domain-containing protein [Lentzea sp. BCCO 10_0061]MDX8146930.1 RHS repeat-associated core domain-containing protein [Lentzea sp. BCCO 10_0061]
MARTLTVVLTSSVLTTSFATTALAAGPSVPLPGTSSTPVSEQRMGSRAPDQASTGALSGDQPGGTAPEGGGDPAATPLSPSANWDVSAHTGDFGWTYPLRVPPSPGGHDPELALAYSSSSVDGRTSATNNQASWAGDGWELSAGFVERRYGGCADDKAGGTTPPKESGDLCWRSDNAVAAFQRGGGQLIRDDATGQWRAESDNGSRIERLTGAANGDNDGEHWRITMPDGTQYLFGSRPEAGSAWTVPVFGDDTGEPCHGDSFGASMCTQVWRWNLDKVIDRHGNEILYNYTPETNSYGANNKDAAVSYVRGGTLKSVDYGLRDGQPQATGRVEFTAADRCVPGSDCKPEKKDNWPDVPWDAKCDTTTCKDKHAPTFWTTKRLDSVTTKVWNGSSFSDADRWTLEQAYPAPGDGEKAALWLKGITHTGLAGAPAPLPQVTFEGTKMPNRVNSSDGVGPLIRYRVTGIVSESGGVTSINYEPPNCAAGSSMPANPESNTLRCYPAKWAKKDFSERTDYFHKYVVREVVQSDRISSSPEHVTGYAYLDGAAWAYDDSEFTKDANRTWNEFRGFGKVEIRQGKTGDPSGPVTLTEKRFHRGMHGDKQPAGTRAVKVVDSEGTERTDEKWLRGLEFESQVRNGAAVVEKTISTPVVRGPTASRGSYQAYIVRPGTEAVHTAIEAGTRVTRVETTYDDRGLPVSTNDLGDVSKDSDDRCVRITYGRNTDRWLLVAVARTETVAVACTATPVFPRDAIGDTRNAFDGKGFGEVPVAGDVTRTEVLKERPATGPVYAPGGTAAHDAYGRQTSASDPLGRTTTTRYVPATGPAKEVVSTNPLGHQTTTSYEPFFGQPTTVVDANGRKTETTYDALGRKTEVWLPNRAKADGVRGNAYFSYAYRKDAPTVVTSTTIGPNGRYTSGNELYDGLLRLRQVQSPAPGGGRLVMDTRYDSQGRTYKTTMPYFNDGAVDDKLWLAADTDLPMHTVHEFDGAGRQIATITKAGAAEKWRTTTAFGGDRTHVTPPQGGTAMTTVVDARGQKVELRQHHGAVTGSYDSTKYTYTASGQLASVVDPAGSTWRFGYDLRGRKVSEEHPDRGPSAAVYDDAGRLVSTTDARNVTLTSSYDDLGRKTKLASGATTLSEWSYDTASFGKGQPATEVRYVNGNAYKTQILGYNALYKPLGRTVTIPATEQTLAGTYTTNARFNVDGSVSGTTFPAIGDLAAEPVTHEYDDLGKPTRTYAGMNGNTEELVSSTEYTRYGELARTQLGTTGKRVWLSRYYDTNTRRLERTIVDAEVPNPKQSDATYTYDPSGNVKSVVDGDDAQCFRMDHLQRITEAWTPGNGCAADPGTASLSGPAPYWHSYVYDKAGNRLTETQHAAAGDTVRTATLPAPGGSHQLRSVETKSPSATTTQTFSYDATGNMTVRDGQKFDWDAEGRIARVTEGDKVTEYVHDAGGDRLIRRDPTGVTLYLDGQELRLDRATGKLTATRFYQHGAAVVAVRVAGGLTWLANDHQATAQISVRSGDLAVERRRQLPFGGPRGAAGAFPGEKGFVGGTNDASTGLVQLGARAYDPALGRFVSVDPIMDPEDPQQMHGYTYANNSPLTKSDPSGLFWGELFDTLGDKLGEAFDFLKENKSWLAVGIGIISMVPGIGTGVGVALFVASTALGAWDTAEAVGKGDTTQAGLGALGLIGGGLGQAFKLATKGVRAAASVDVKNTVGFINDSLGVSSGATAAAIADRQEEKERLAKLPDVERARLRAQLGWTKMGPAPAKPLPPYKPPTDWGCQTDSAGPAKCSTVDSVRAESGRCKNIFGAGCQGMAKKRPPVNLGPHKAKHRGTKYYDRRGNEVGGARSMPKDGKYQTSDGFWHPAGGGRAYF